MKNAQPFAQGAHVLFRVSDGASLVTPRLPASSVAVFRSRLTADMRRLLLENATRAKMPPNVLAGFAFAESKLDPAAVSPKGATGILQVMPFAWPKGASSADMKGAAYGMRVGAGIFGGLGGLKANGIARLASRYNAGSAPGGVPHASVSSPWGVREDAGYIDRVIAASNVAAELLDAPAASDGAALPLLAAAVAAVALS